MIPPLLNEYYITNFDNILRYIITFYFPAALICYKYTLSIWEGKYTIDQIIFIYMFLMTTLRGFIAYIKKEHKEQSLVSVDSYSFKVLYWFGLKDSPVLERTFERIESIEKTIFKGRNGFNGRMKNLSDCTNIF